MRKLQSKRMLGGGFGRFSEHLETRGSRRARLGSHLKSRKFGEWPEEQVEGSKVFGTSPEDRVVLNGPRGTWPDSARSVIFTSSYCVLPELYSPLSLTHVPVSRE